MNPETRQSGPAFRFGVFEVDLRSGDLRRDGMRVKLRGQPFALLAMLLQRRGDLVTREELRERLWPADTFVDFDHGLNAAMNKLREALGDSADNPRFIETIPRRGYRFIAPVSGPAADAPVASSGAVPTWRAGARRHLVVAASALALLAALGFGLRSWRRPTAGAPRSEPLRLAVLPFQNIGDDAEQEYFVDGMTDALIAELAQIHGLRVISRTSVMSYKATRKTLPQIARELRVDAVVEGSAVRSGDRVRITAQLIDAAADRQLWSRRYESRLGDVLDVQRRVAREVTEGVRVVVTAHERERLQRPAAVSPQAHEAYLRGRFLRDRLTADDLRRSLQYFQRAIEADPGYASAHAGLADAYWIIGVPGFEVMPQSETAPLARAAARRALELDPSDATARAILAMVSIYYDWDWPEAEKSLRSILEQNPSLARVHIWYSGYLAGMGRSGEAIEAARHGLELDPLSPTAGQTLGMRYLYAGSYASADVEFKKSLELDARAFVARMGLGESQWLQGRQREAIAEVERADADSGGSPWVLSWLGFAYGASGEHARARSVLTRLEAMAGRRYVPHFYRALVQVGLGESEAAIDSLERAHEERSGWMVFLNVQPELASLRSHPRFRALLQRVGHKPA